MNDKLTCAVADLWLRIGLVLFLALALCLSPPVLAEDQGPAPFEAPLLVPTPAEGAPVTPPAPVATVPEKHNLSPWGMFEGASAVVRGVMVGLAAASLVTWTVFVAKSLEIALARVRLRRALRLILGSAGLREAERALSRRKGIAATMVRTAVREVEASAESANVGLLDRVASYLSRAEAREGRRINAGTGVLATIGSTAPFIGLFGTVWGIMNSFIGIADTNTTNLAVVAPGIAEALLATALGLVAAIPAVVIYNHFARSLTGYRALLADAAAAIECLVSRDLDHDRLGVPLMRRAAE